MKADPNTVTVSVSHRFDASAERVYDAFLDPEQAGRFLFATATGQILRCDIDARVGGGFVIVDRRNGEDVVHTGKYLELDRARRIVFSLWVEKYGAEADIVTIEIIPRPEGCELSLTHQISARAAPFTDRAQTGWVDSLAVAGEILVDEAPTCGIGLAQHAAIPEKVGMMFEGLAETLELHRKMLMLDDPNARTEDEVYADLARRWQQIAALVHDAAGRMAAQRDLAMGAHDETAWTEDHLRAFEKFVTSETQLLALLRVSGERDERMLASMKSG